MLTELYLGNLYYSYSYLKSVHTFKLINYNEIFKIIYILNKEIYFYVKLS